MVGAGLYPAPIFLEITININNKTELIVMDQILGNLINTIAHGGPQAIYAVFILVIIAMGLHIKKLHTMLDKKDEKVDKIVEQYHTSSAAVIETLNSLKLVLWEVRGRIGLGSRLDS